MIHPRKTESARSADGKPCDLHRLVLDVRQHPGEREALGRLDTDEIRCQFRAEILQTAWRVTE
jgi:hypothetical protein